MSLRSPYSTKSVWLATIVITVFLWTLYRFSDHSPPSDTQSRSQTTPTISEADIFKFESELADEPLQIYVPPAEIPSDRLIKDVLHQPEKPYDGPSDSEAYHNGPPPSPKKDCPLDCAKPKDRPLILYAYSESDFGRINLQFFSDHGLHDAADFIFILNGETDVDEKIIPQNHDNIKVIKRENTCFDLGAHAAVLSKEENGEKPLKDRYQRFILMNASIRGPFLPHWSKECWSDTYLGKVTDKVKLVGSSINCFNGNGAHVQSMIWATDQAGLSTILVPEGISECFDTLQSAMNGEIRTTPLIRSKGYEVDVMLSVFQSEANYADCTDGSDYLWQDSYFGFSVHPFETLFVKSNRNIEPETLNKLTEWTDKAGYSSYSFCSI